MTNNPKTSALFGTAQCAFSSENFVGTLGKGTSVVIPIRLYGIKGDCKGFVLYDLTCAQADYLSNFTFEFVTPCVRVRNSVIKEFTHDGYILFKVTALVDGEVRVFFTLQANSGDAQAKILTAFPDAVIQSVEIVRNRTPRIRVRWSGDLVENLVYMTRLLAIRDGCEDEVIVRRGLSHGNASYLVMTDEDHNEQQEVHGDYSKGVGTSEISTEPGYSVALEPDELLYDLKYGSSDDGYSIPKIFFQGKCLKIEARFISYAHFLIIEVEDIREEVVGNSFNVIITGDDDRDNFLLGKTLEVFYADTFTRITKDINLQNFDENTFFDDVCQELDPYIDIQTFIGTSVCPPQLIVQASTSTQLESHNYLVANQFDSCFKALMNNVNVFSWHRCNAVCPGNIVSFDNILAGLCPDQSLRGILVTARRVKDLQEGDFDIDHEDRLLDFMDIIICGRSIHVDYSTTKAQLMNMNHAPEHFNFLFVSFVHDFDDKNSISGSLPLSCLCSRLLCGLPLFIKLKDPDEIGNNPVQIHLTIFTNNATIFTESLLTSSSCQQLPSTVSLY